VGADDELCAAAGLDGALVGELSDELHGAEADDECLWDLESFVCGAVLGVEVLFEIGFELWEWEDGHGVGRARVRRPEEESMDRAWLDRGRRGMGRSGSRKRGGAASAP
jgi:hypothetical protein